jgi:hypothetical protein
MFYGIGWLDSIILLKKHQEKWLAKVYLWCRLAGRSNMHGDGRGWLAKWANPLLRRYPGWPFVAVPCLFICVAYPHLLFQHLGMLAILRSSHASAEFITVMYTFSEV